MKKLLLLPLLFLVSCAATPGQEPFKAGDKFVVTGKTKEGQAYNQTFTLRGKGEYDDGDWDYDADGNDSYSAYVSTSKEQDFLWINDEYEPTPGSGKDGGRRVICFVSPDGPGWKTVTDGYLISGTAAEVSALFDTVSKLSKTARFNAFVKATGECSVTRP